MSNSRGATLVRPVACALLALGAAFACTASTGSGASSSSGAAGMVAALGGGEASNEGGTAASTAGKNALGGGGAGQGGARDAGTPQSSNDAASDAAAGASGAAPTLPARVLLYHFSTLDIPTLPAQLSFFSEQLSALHFASDDSVDPSVLSDANLERYAAVAMINTCFEPFGQGKPDQPQAGVLQRFVQRGGGLFGTHCAAVTFQSQTPPSPYNQLLGGRGGNGFFDGTSACRTLVTHATTATLPASFTFNGNLDNNDYIAPDTTVLVKCKWQGSTGDEVAVSWVRTEGAGRVFYTDFAKVDADLSDATLGPHVLAGLTWVLGLR